MEVFLALKMLDGEAPMTGMDDGAPEGVESCWRDIFMGISVGSGELSMVLILSIFLATNLGFLNDWEKSKLLTFSLCKGVDSSFGVLYSSSFDLSVFWLLCSRDI
jgi:hypothetical protein